MMIDPKTLDKESLYLLQIKTLHQGKKQERQRIIKLAEQRICFSYKNGCEHGACHSLADLIALIKDKANA